MPGSRTEIYCERSTLPGGMAFTPFLKPVIQLEVHTACSFQLVSTVVQMPTAAAAVTRLIEEVKARLMSAKAEVHVEEASRTVMHELTVKLERPQKCGMHWS